MILSISAKVSFQFTIYSSLHAGFYCMHAFYHVLFLEKSNLLMNIIQYWQNCLDPDQA